MGQTPRRPEAWAAGAGGRAGSPGKQWPFPGQAQASDIRLHGDVRRDAALQGWPVPRAALGKAALFYCAPGQGVGHGAQRQGWSFKGPPQMEGGQASWGMVVADPTRPALGLALGSVRCAQGAWRPGDVPAAWSRACSLGTVRPLLFFLSLAALTAFYKAYLFYLFFEMKFT